MAEPNPMKSIRYAVYIEEHLAPCWRAWFEGVSIRPLETGGTLLDGFFTDQAALHGLLGKIRDLNLTLIAVTQINPFAREPESTSGGKP